MVVSCTQYTHILLILISASFFFSGKVLLSSVVTSGKVGTGNMSHEGVGFQSPAGSHFEAEIALPEEGAGVLSCCNVELLLVSRQRSLESCRCELWVRLFSS